MEERRRGDVDRFTGPPPMAGPGSGPAPQRVSHAQIAVNCALVVPPLTFMFLSVPPRTLHRNLFVSVPGTYRFRFQAAQDPPCSSNAFWNKGIPSVTRSPISGDPGILEIRCAELGE
jgi:hypothetical protein